MKFNPFSSSSIKNNQIDDTPTQVNENIKPKVVQVASDELEDMKKVILLASKMRSLLEQCRYESLPMNLAKNIDAVLRDAQQFD